MFGELGYIVPPAGDISSLPKLELEGSTVVKKKKSGNWFTDLLADVGKSYAEKKLIGTPTGPALVVQQRPPYLLYGAIGLGLFLLLRRR